MKAYLDYLNEIASNVEKQHSKYDQTVNWFHPYKSYELEDRKKVVFNSIEDKINWNFKKTKPWINSLSPGCQICGEGEWSCLFITGMCNGGCFYCPAQQDRDETPQTQKLLFEKPEVYVDYINRFKFKGVSFSGGEPLMVFDRTLNFIENVRNGCEPSIYIWMYTNGILATEEKFKLLGNAGLNEIRFDMGAVNYNPKALKSASKYIKNVTVEIPAVPEEKEKLFEVIPLLCEYDVTNLNLHQLRLTAYNSSKLLNRDYTYLHGEQPVVLESEITAFEVMKFVMENNLPIGVNYCNLQFKNRFQKAGFRRKMATELKTEVVEITENGYLRKIEAIVNSVAKVVLLAELTKNREEISLIKVTYTGKVLENLQKTINGSFYKIGDVSYPIVEGLATSPINLSGNLIDGFIEMISGSGNSIPEHPLLFEAWKFEFIEEGMREYF